MNSKERVKLALTREGTPDRIPIEFDLCKSLIKHFGTELGIEPDLRKPAAGFSQIRLIADPSE